MKCLNSQIFGTGVITCEYMYEYILKMNDTYVDPLLVSSLHLILLLPAM